jgi:hypothetical protein
MRFLTVVFTFYFSCVVGQDPQQYINAITSQELKTHLQVLASDEFEGRETGEKGQKLAAAYLKKEFSNYGLLTAPGLDDYYQKFTLQKFFPGGIIRTPKGELVFGNDFLYTGIDTLIQEQVTWVIGDYVNRNVNDQDVAVIVQQQKESLRDLIVSTEAIKQNGYKGVVFLIHDWDSFLDLYGHYFGESKLLLPGERSVSFPLLFVAKKSFESVISPKEIKRVERNKKKTILQIPVTVQLVDSIGKIETENVLGIVPGTDANLAHEVVVLTAHYDHLGIENGVVFNGADDDGSGTVALLEIAESFSQALKDGNGPRRTILIMPVTAEEKGLLGSKFYVKNPVFPLKETIANLNIDMIGRTDNFHTNPNYVYVIGSDRLSDDLHRMNEEAAKEYGKVELDYKYNTKDDPNRFYYRSDHYNFVVHGVPSIFYFSGIHEDYHQPTDTVDKIDFEKMENVARMIFLTAWKLANSNDRPVVNRISE